MKSMIAATALGIVAGLATFSTANADARVEIGVLKCIVDAGEGLVFSSTKTLNCDFRRVNGEAEHYTGHVNKFGIDIGKTSRTTIVWGVLAPSRNVPPGALVGRYGGLSAEATAGIGVGVNAMLGGSKNTIALQPFSVQAQQGLNVAAGIGAMELRLK